MSYISMLIKRYKQKINVEFPENQPDVFELFKNNQNLAEIPAMH